MGTIYMLLCRVAAFSYIKLGHTEKPFQARLQHIRAGIPFNIDVLATRPGTKEQEKELLVGARAWRHDIGGREWFVDCPELRTFWNAFFFDDWEITPEALPDQKPPAVEAEPSLEN